MQGKTEERGEKLLKILIPTSILIKRTIPGGIVMQ
jgi:hypothetical protein